MKPNVLCEDEFENGVACFEKARRMFSKKECSGRPSLTTNDFDGKVNKKSTEQTIYGLSISEYISTRFAVSTDKLLTKTFGGTGSYVLDGCKKC